MGSSGVHLTAAPTQRPPGDRSQTQAEQSDRRGFGNQNQLAANFATRKIRIVDVHVKEAVLKITYLRRGNREGLLGNRTGSRGKDS